MAAIGSCWAPNTWGVDAWAADTWATGVVPPPVATEFALVGDCLATTPDVIVRALVADPKMRAITPLVVLRDLAVPPIFVENDVA